MTDCRSLLPLCLTWQVGGFRGHYCRIHTGLRGCWGSRVVTWVAQERCWPGRAGLHIVPWVGVSPGCLQTRCRLLVRLRARMAAHSPFRKLLHVCPTSHSLRTAVEVTLATLECARSSLPELRPGRRREAGFPNSSASTKPFSPRLIKMAYFFPCCFWNLNLEKVCRVVMQTWTLPGGQAPSLSELQPSAGGRGLKWAGLPGLCLLVFLVIL